MTDDTIKLAEAHAWAVAEQTGSPEAGVRAFREALAQTSPEPSEPSPRPHNPHVRDGDPDPRTWARLPEADRLDLERADPGISDRVVRANAWNERQAEHDPREREQERVRRENDRADDPLANEMEIRRREFEAKRRAEMHEARLAEKARS